jgi:alpha-glucosidase
MKREAVDSSHRFLVVLGFLLGMNLATTAQTPRTDAPPASGPATVVHDSEAEGLYNPIADPRAIVEFGNARFTVLTPQLIRMEWSANGKFEDRASLVFLNRRLPVPKFEKSSTDGNKTLTIATDGLKLTYTPEPKGSSLGFTAENLEISLTVNDKKVIWHPGQAAPGQFTGHRPLPRWRERHPTPGPDGTGPGLSLRMGPGRRHHAAAIRFHRFHFPPWRKKPVALGP